MSTRSSISVKQLDGSIKTVYCHFDGYHSHVGKMLLKHYNSQEQANAIVNLGDLSALHESIECPQNHSYDEQITGYSVFYGRDRGEKDINAREYASFEKAMLRDSQEFDYYWDGSQWLVDEEVLTKEMTEEI